MAFMAESPILPLTLSGNIAHSVESDNLGLLSN